MPQNNLPQTMDPEFLKNLELLQDMDILEKSSEWDMVDELDDLLEVDKTNKTSEEAP